jgi:hypothetical protein
LKPCSLILFLPSDYILGDNWKIELPGGGLFSSAPQANTPIKRGEPFRLLHVDTGKYLYSHKMKFGHPIPGQMEVVASSTKNDNSLWIAEVGFRCISTVVRLISDRKGFIFPRERNKSSCISFIRH